MTTLDDKRREFARASLRKQVEVIRIGTPMAEAPLTLHKSIYTSQNPVSYTHLTLPTTPYV